MLVPRQTLNGRHPATAQCARGAEWKSWQFAEGETRESSEQAFEAYWEPIQNVSTFRYLGSVLTAGDNDWLAVVGNLGKARKSWGRLSRILIREGEYPKVSGNVYKAMAQLVLLFGAKMWVLTPSMEQALDSFLTNGCKENHREAAAASTDGWGMGIPASGRESEGSGVQGDKEVGHKEAEHGRAIYCDATDSGPL